MGDETYGQAPVKAEGEAVGYDYNPRSHEEQVAHYQRTIMNLRQQVRKLDRFKRMAKQQQIMIASKEGFTLVEDLDEYLTNLTNAPLSKADIIREGLEQLEEAFGMNYKVDPNVNYKWVKP